MPGSAAQSSQHGDAVLFGGEFFGEYDPPQQDDGLFQTTEATHEKLKTNKPVFIRHPTVPNHNPFDDVKRAPRRLRREASQQDEVDIKYNK